MFTKNALASVDPSKTKVISFDTIPPAPELLKEGKVQVLLGQKYFGWGSESVRLLYDIAHGRKPAKPIIDSGVDVVTSRNVDEYLWQGRSGSGSKTPARPRSEAERLDDLDRRQVIQRGPRTPASTLAVGHQPIGPVLAVDEEHVVTGLDDPAESRLPAKLPAERVGTEFD